MSYAALSERVFSALGDFLRVEEWRILKSNVFVWNSVSNWGKPSRRLFRCCNRLMGRTVWAVRNVTSGNQRFKSGRTSIEDDPKSGRTSSSTGDDHIEKVRSVIRGNRRLTIREVSEEVGICKSSCNTILTEKLKMHRVAAKFVPRLLTEEQKQNRVSQSGAIRSFEYWWNLSEKVITGDETWVYDYDVETKVQSSQWVGKSSPRQNRRGHWTHVHSRPRNSWLIESGVMWLRSKWSLKSQLHSSTITSVLRRLTGALFQMFGIFSDWPCIFNRFTSRR